MSGPVVGAAASVAVNGTILGPTAAAASSRAAPAQRITTFASGHGYVNGSGGTGTVSDDTGDYVLGSQSLKLVTDGIGGITRPTKQSIGPFDFSAQAVRLLVKVDAASQARMRSMSLYLSNEPTAFTNYYVATFTMNQAGGNPPYFLDNDWIMVTIDRGEFTAVGSPVWTNIQQVRLAVQDQGTGGVPVSPITVHWQAVDGIADPAGPCISLTFDDGWLSSYTLARPYMDKYGFPATLYQIVESAKNADTLGTGTTNTMTTAMIQQLARTSGWDIGCHAYTLARHNSANGFLDFTDAEIEQEFKQSQDWLVANGLGGPSIQHFAWPKGQFDAAKLAVARKYFRSVRTIFSQNHETYPPGDRMRIRDFNTATNTNNLAATKAAIDKCIANKTWLLLMFHDISVGAPSGGNAALQTQQSDFNAIMDWISGKGATVKVRTVGDVIANGVS